jgi:hypothetical protein
MKQMNDDDALALFNRLLEMLHQADGNNQGSNFTLVYVASGGQHVEHQYVLGDKALEKPEKKEGTNKPELSPELSTPEAMTLWRKAQQAGYVDEDYQPLISRTQSAILAFEMARRLAIKEKWKVFETLWNRRNMYRDYYDGMSQDQTYLFLDKLKELFDS